MCPRVFIVFFYKLHTFDLLDLCEISKLPSREMYYLSITIKYYKNMVILQEKGTKKQSTYL